MNDQTMMSSGWSPARLIVRQGAQLNEVFELPQATVTIGRESGLDVSIRDPEMSRRHAQVKWQAGGYVLEDLGSTNGTTVNGVRVTGAHSLASGDEIGVGHTVLEFVWQPSAQQAAPPRYSEPDTYQVPAMPAPPPPQVPPAAAPPAPAEKGKSNCLLIGCGCLVLLGLLALVLVALAMFVIPEQLQPILDENGIPIQLVKLATHSLIYLV